MRHGEIASHEPAPRTWGKERASDGEEKRTDPNAAILTADTPMRASQMPCQWAPRKICVGYRQSESALIRFSLVAPRPATLLVEPAKSRFEAGRALAIEVAATLGEAGMRQRQRSWHTTCGFRWRITTARHGAANPTSASAHGFLFYGVIIMPNSTKSHLRNARRHARDGVQELGTGVREATRQGEAAGESLRAAAASMAGAAEDRLSDLAHGLSDLGHAAVDFASQGAQQLRERATATLADGQARARRVGESIESRIQQRPVRSVCIAAIAGFVLGLFFLRRRS